jgi:hypothetical protein
MGADVGELAVADRDRLVAVFTDDLGGTVGVLDARAFVDSQAARLRGGELARAIEREVAGLGAERQRDVSQIVVVRCRARHRHRE